jgi:chaperonin GroEL
LQKRLARFSGSAGVLKIGARTKAERQVLHSKAEQGLKVALATLAEGVLPGGGIAFVWAAQTIEVDTAVNEDERMGLIATKKALEAPFYRIFENAKKPAAAVALQRVLAAGEGHVYDVLREAIEPAQEAGVMDAAKVLRRVLETAASGAEMALSVDVTVLKKRPMTNFSYEP